ncbi:MAG: 6-phosphofructokinase [Bryobacterales bacterium]|nr:6-phosphofructokinase [Bryobacterales bacterium]
MKRIAVLTSGGDAPGMNAAIRAVIRTSVGKGWEAFGVRNGFAGLVGGTFTPMGSRDVSEIMQRGGTILGSARAPQFAEENVRRQALHHLAANGIEALVVIGGNGSQTGAHALSAMGFPVVGIASTIDNDLYGSDVTLGVDTALNIALEAIDRLKVTASSHQRAFLVEVMGRDCGYLALMAGIAGGAEAIVIPEVDVHPDKIAEEVRAAHDRGKPHVLIVVAEGARCSGEALKEYMIENRSRVGFQFRLTILGHVQRGGTPTFADRMLGTRLGAAAVEQIAKGNTGILTGLQGGQISATPLSEVVVRKKPLDMSLLELAGVLAV